MVPGTFPCAPNGTEHDPKSKVQTNFRSIAFFNNTVFFHFDRFIRIVFKHATATPNMSEKVIVAIGSTGVGKSALRSKLFSSSG
jgi:predicted GTPase